MFLSEENLHFHEPSNLQPNASFMEIPPNELMPTKNIFVGIYILLIVIVSFLANLVVIIVMIIRPQRLRSTHLCIIALSCSDILFSLSIHPMLIATSFGADTLTLFSKQGCNWYGAGAVFFGCLSMIIHVTISVVRYLSVARGFSGYLYIFGFLI